MPRRPSKVLIADDIEFNRSLLRRLAESIGLQAIECSSGLEAVHAFARHRGSVVCVLMDINMPGMDGLEAAWRIRRFEAEAASNITCPVAYQAFQKGSSMLAKAPSEGGNEACHVSGAAEVPIWAISACGDGEQVHSPVASLLASSQECGPLWQRVGINIFLPKPVNISALLARLAELNSWPEKLGQPLSNFAARQEAEALEEKGLQKRCSLDAPAETMVSKLPRSMMMLTSKVTE